MTKKKEFSEYYDVIRNVMAEPAPCDGCDKAQRCKEEEVACRLFGMYVVFGKFPKDFEPTYRHPNKEMFNKIFSNDERLPKELRKAQQEEADKKVRNERNHSRL